MSEYFDWAAAAAHIAIPGKTYVITSGPSGAGAAPAEFSPGVQATIARWDAMHATEANMQRADEPDDMREFDAVRGALRAGVAPAIEVALLRAALAAYDALAASQTPVATPSKPGVPLSALRVAHRPGYGGLR